MNRMNAVAAFLLVGLVAGCSETGTGPAEVTEPSLAKGGTPGGPGGGGGGDDGGTADRDANFYFPDSGTGIVSDGAERFTTEGTTAYLDNECGVQGTLFATSGDATMKTDDAGGGARKCSDFPRKLVFAYQQVGPNGTLVHVGADSVSVYLNLQGVADMTEGELRTVPLNVGLNGSAYCESLRFRTYLRDDTAQESPIGADYVQVTRGIGSWTATNVGIDTDGDGVAAEVACVNGGVNTAIYVMPFEFTVTAVGQ